MADAGAAGGRTSRAMQEAHDLIAVRLGQRKFELRVSPRIFRPSATTMLFARVVEVPAGSVVFDIGCGVGPLAIWSALEGASSVYAVDPLPEHVELAIANRDAYGLADRIDVRRGEYFEPLGDLRADVVIADVSGIADPASRALGWYPAGVPTGGRDGTRVITELIRRAPGHLRPGGVLYFAVARDLSRHRAILDLARRTFASVTPASREFKVALSEQQMRALEHAYGDRLPDFVTPVQLRGKHFWRGRVWRASRRPEASPRPEAS